MTEKELEIAVTAHEMQRLELKEAFGERLFGGNPGEEGA